MSNNEDQRLYKTHNHWSSKKKEIKGDFRERKQLTLYKRTEDEISDKNLRSET